MNKTLIIANWKSHKTIEQSIAFLQDFTTNGSGLNLANKEIVICPSFHALATVGNYIERNHLPLKIGAQNISEFFEGAYTGEVAASQIKNLVDYVIIGHSERRETFHETDETVEKKVNMALANGIVPIACVQNENNAVPEGAIYVAYEPPCAIGSGIPDSPSHVQSVFQSLDSRFPRKKFIYGGSVTPDNILDYVSLSSLAGFLVGGASLDATQLCRLVSVW